MTKHEGGRILGRRKPRGALGQADRQAIRIGLGGFADERERRRRPLGPAGFGVPAEAPPEVGRLRRAKRRQHGGHMPSQGFVVGFQRQVGADDVGRQRLVGQPAEQVVAGLARQSHGEMQGGPARPHRRVPVASGQVEHVTGFEDHLFQRLGGPRVIGVQVAPKWRGTGGTVEHPPLGALQLDHEHVVVVPVDVESLAGPPAGIEIRLTARRELAGQAGA